MKRTTRKQTTTAFPNTPPIRKVLAESEATSQLLVDNLQRALHHADAVEAMLLLPLIQRAAELRNDVVHFHSAMKERLGTKR